MELKAHIDYYSFYCTLKAGKTTVGLDLPEEEKERMLRQFPGWFEVLGEEGEKAPEQVEQAGLEIETKEQTLAVESKEDPKAGKADKTKRK